MKVSVCMITYNHESYISQAIEGVLMQKFDSDFELVIGEDFSTDATRKICEFYAQSYPEIIRLLPSEKNLGAIPNFIRTLNECNGNYIACCEGDDYWTDPTKLKKQVDFLEANPEFSICFHQVTILNENFPEFTTKSNLGQKEISTLEDLALGNIIGTLSCVFRNAFINNYPEFIKDCPLGDYPLHLLNAQFGKIRYFDENMAVYRIHKDGLWEIKQEEEKIKMLVYTLDHLIGRFDKNINFLLAKNQLKNLASLAEIQDNKLTIDNGLYIPKGLITYFRTQEEMFVKVMQSRTYRLGLFLTWPYQYLKKLFKWLK